MRQNRAVYRKNVQAAASLLSKNQERKTFIGDSLLRKYFRGGGFVDRDSLFEKIRYSMKSYS
jgi:hypothetical protein